MLTDSPRSDPRNAAVLAAVYVCFVLSGVAALVYQTAWTREFALLFGTSELAIAAVLAAYMGGLALGAFIIERYLGRVVRPVRLYALLELGIALSALVLIPLTLRLADSLLIAFFGGQSAPPSSDHLSITIFYLASSAAALLLPTTLMGATLPLLARHAVRSEEEIGSRIGGLYASNTAGAVAGALLTALYLLPKFGLSKTIWAAAAINILVAALAYWLALGAASANASSMTRGAGPGLQLRFTLRISTAWVLPLMLLSGAVSFLHEVLWTRMLSHVLGSAIYAFGVMVASFLAGIALGGGAGAILARSQATAARCLAFAELLAAAAAAGAWFAIQHWTPAQSTLFTHVSFGFCVLFPLAFAIGLTYPLAVRVLSHDANIAAAASARVYTWNTVGAIIGAIAAGFFLIPALRYEGSIQLAVIASCVLAVMAALALMPPSKTFGYAVAGAAVLGALLFHPSRPDTLLRLSPINVSGAGDMVFYDVGRSADVVVLSQGSRLMLRTNGLPEASMDGIGTVPLLNVESWMAPLAVLARPNLESMLMVGLGAGRAVDAVPPTVRTIDLIELEPKVVSANLAVGNLRQHDPMADSRVNIVLNDARGSLSLSSKRYDGIVSQPSHPWTAGASHLYTREFMQQAREHLNPGGVFVQWMNTDFLDEGLFKSLVATLAEVFPQVRVYRPAPTTLLFLGSDKTLDPEREIGSTKAALARAPGHYGRIGLNAVEDLAAIMVLDNDSARRFASGAPLITDDANRFATDVVYDFGRNISLDKMSELLAPYDPLTHADSFMHRELASKFSFDYIGRRLALMAAADHNIVERIDAMAKLFANTELFPYLRSIVALRSQQVAMAQDTLKKALSTYPDSPLLLSAYLDNWASPLAFDRAPADIAALTKGLSEEGQLVLRGAHYAAHNQWDMVAAADTQLAKVPWTSFWNTQANQLRLEWRSRVQNPELRQRLSDEAVAIADRLGIFEPNVMLFAQRAWNAVGADRPQLLLESISQFAVTVRNTASTADAGTRPAVRNHLANLSKVFEELAKDPRVSAARVAEVRSELADATRLVGAG